MAKPDKAKKEDKREDREEIDQRKAEKAFLGGVAVGFGVGGRAPRHAPRVDQKTRVEQQRRRQRQRPAHLREGQRKRGLKPVE